MRLYDIVEVGYTGDPLNYSTVLCLSLVFEEKCIEKENGMQWYHKCAIPILGVVLT